MTIATFFNKLTETSEALNNWLRAQEELTRPDAAGEAFARVIEQQKAVALAMERAVQGLSFSVPALPTPMLYPKIRQAPRLETPIVSGPRTIVQPQVKRKRQSGFTSKDDF